ncbi:MAG: MaoC family dehydratase [Actinophytocola sp.]|nr:MaoC family dehydratase [Actinophytocola sp.]
MDPAKAKDIHFDPRVVTIERGRLRFFAQAIGETDPIYSDVDVAKQAGHADLPVPPTFFFSMELESPDAFGYLSELDIDLRRVLHGEQSFTYHSMAYAGETLTLRPRIVDAYSKKGGTLDFIVKRTNIERADGAPVADATSVIIARGNRKDAR